MSRRKDHWQRQRGGESGWESANFRKPRPPLGLRGKEIGLYYRDRNKRNRGNNTKEFCIKLNVPKLVVSKLIDSLKSIAKLAKKQNVKLHPTNTSIIHKMDLERDVPSKTNSSRKEDQNFVMEPKLKQTKTESSQHIEPGTSAMPDYIEIGSDDDPDVNYDRILNLRGGGDYFKYGYKDIITGTFEEKLDGSLAKGINVIKTNSDISSLNLALYEDHQNTMTKKQYQKMMSFRETLPTYKKRKELLEIINENQVIVISGETGCGKSTQVPQIILDDAIMNKKGGNVKILVTQPRRIAASSLAARVAAERAEKMGNAVGYAVRLEKTESRPRGSIMFCTTGILLVDLELNQALGDYSHVILDEVHERDCHIDFAMLMLKQILPKRKDLKLILMSATLDADTLCAYFNNCPKFHIEGLAYPVTDIYLEEILQSTNFQLKEEVQKAPQKPHHRHLRKFKEAVRECSEKAIQYKAEIAPWLESIKKLLKPSVYSTLQDHRIEELNIDLVFEVVKLICKGPPGAILVFLPGIGEITKLMKLIQENVSQMGSVLEVYPLHSKLPTLEQHKIFERPPGNIRKVVVATNIAETSITIDDIVYVVDCGKIKYNGLNVEHYFSTLKTEWVSQANMHQRRGRAGRCQPGICYHLLTSFRASKLDDRLLPELQRSNLLEPVLTIKRLRLGRAADALRNVPDSPADTTIERAITHLQQCGALDDDETLTPLGWHLARLPVHPAAGKLLLLGALFGCVDRAASLAAVWSFKDPFILVIEKEDEMKAAKRDLALGEPSDHVALAEAVIQWENCRPRERRTFAYDYFLSHNTLELLSDMKRQLADNLKQMGFLNSGLKYSWENRNWENVSLFKAVVAASLYPNITSARWINLNARNPNKQVRVCPRTPEGPVSIHPSSIMSPPKRKSKFPPRKVDLCNSPGANWLVYWLKQKSSDLFLIDVTLVYTLPLLFFGELKVSEIQDDPNSCNISITSYKVQMRKDTAELLFRLRALLDQVLASKIMVSNQQSTHHSEFEEQVLNAVISVITAEDERAEYIEASESDLSECD